MEAACEWCDYCGCVECVKTNKKYIYPLFAVVLLLLWFVFLGLWARDCHPYTSLPNTVANNTDVRQYSCSLGGETIDCCYTGSVHLNYVYGGAMHTCSVTVGPKYQLTAILALMSTSYPLGSVDTPLYSSSPGTDEACVFSINCYTALEIASVVLT